MGLSTPWDYDNKATKMLKRATHRSARVLDTISTMNRQHGSKMLFGNAKMYLYTTKL